MNLIKRLTTSVTATFGSAVGQLENHDAIVCATIKQNKQAVAKTQARTNILKQQQIAYEAQLKEAKDQEQIWTQRARDLRLSDQDKALRCLSRSNQFKQEIERLTSLIEQQYRLVLDVSDNLRKLKVKLEEMTHKHNLMRSRQTVAEVNRSVASVDSGELIDDTFERWESQVLEHEFEVSNSCTRDSLDDDLTSQEHELELLAQLESLAHESQTQKENTNE